MAELRPTELLDYKGPLYVRNMTKSRISHDDTKGNRLNLSPSGKEGDLDLLPIEVAQHPGFQKIWRRGAVVVSSDTTLEETLSVQDDADEHDVSKWLGGDVSLEQDPGKNILSQVKCSGCSLTDYMKAADAEEHSGKKLCEIPGSSKVLECPNLN